MKDRTFIIIENDYLPILRSIDESEMLVFIGTWHKLVGGYDYLIITSGSELKDEPRYGLCSVNMGLGNTFANFIIEIRMFYMLLEIGVEPEIIYLMISQLRKCDSKKRGYRTLSRRSRKHIVSHADELSVVGNEFWNDLLDRLSQMNPTDRKLFARIHKEIISALGDPNSSDVHVWDDVVFDVMKIVRDGGGEDEVFVHLAPYGCRYTDEAAQTAYEKQRAVTAKKLVKLIQEG
jgi:hypothetical protein